MTRVARAASAGYVYHVLNRAVARLPLFQKDGDYEAFERVLSETVQTHPARLLAYCLMPNHWHFVVWAGAGGRTHRLRAMAHASAYHALAHPLSYSGKRPCLSRPLQEFPGARREHFYQVVRYVERNALRANLVKRAEDWRWSSLWRRQHPHAKPLIPLADWPLPLPPDWLTIVHRPQTEAELDALRRSVNRDAPYGHIEWQRVTAARYNLEHTLRPRGRPRKGPTPPLPPSE